LSAFLKDFENNNGPTDMDYFFISKTAKLQQHFDAQRMRDDHDVLFKFELVCSYTNILKNTESKM